MYWTVQEVAGALRVATPASLDGLARVAGVSIDSRTVARGDLFVAIHGPRHDGHHFVAAALESGALAAVVESGRLSEFPEAIRSKLFAVTGTLAALQNLAHAVRIRWGGRVAAVTGSAGKTTTKEILAALLAARFRVLKSEGNLNNEYGLPLQLLRLEESDQAAVVELGMSHRGEIKRLAEIARPDVAIVTRVAPVHLEFFSSVDEIALAKRELIDALTGSNSVAVLNADDPRVAQFARVAPGRVISYGIENKADFRAEKIEDRGADGSSFDFVGPQGRARVTLPLAGRHNISNALAALAAASVWDITAVDAQEVFPGLQPAGMRGRVLRYDAGFSVINDCYNSNPVALGAMTDLLVHTAASGRRILAAGEMLELGATSGTLHRQAGSAAAQTKKVDWIIGVQGDAEDFVCGAVEAGHPAARAKFFASSGEAAGFIGDLLQRGDLLLVKGSRGVKMERVVEALDRKFTRSPSDSTENAAQKTPPVAARERG
jgi:UDP-N-acetylmuramoyl-tripeptide--D-alanyl-D-alanine ligase